MKDILDMEKVSEELPHPQSNIPLSLLWKHTTIDRSFITISHYCYLKTFWRGLQSKDRYTILSTVAIEFNYG